ALDLAVEHPAAAHGPGRGREQLADLGAAERVLDVAGLDLVEHQRAELLAELVDDLGAAGRDAFGVGEAGDLGSGPHAEAEDRRDHVAAGLPGSGRELDVALGDLADASGDDLGRDLVAADLRDDLLDGLERALDVGAQDQGDGRQRGAALGRQPVGEARRAGAGPLAPLSLLATVVNEHLGGLVVLDGVERDADRRRLVEAGDLDHGRRAARLHGGRLALALGLVLLLLVLLVLLGPGLVVGPVVAVLGLDREIAAGDQRAESTARLAGHDHVAAVEGAALDQHGRDHAATAIDSRLEHDPAGPPLGAGSQLEQLGQHAELIDELVEPGAVLGGDPNDRGLAAVDLGQHAVLHQLALDPGDVGVGQ